MVDQTTLREIATFAFSWLSNYFDGSFVDVGSILVALCFVLWHRHRLPCNTRCAFLSRETGRLLVNAISIFPLFLLAASIFSSKLTELLLGGSKITLTIAGSYALFTMLEDLLSATSTALKEDGVQPHFMGPPAPLLAPQHHTREPSTPAHQLGKVEVLAGQPTLSKSQKRRRAQAAKRQAAAQQAGRHHC